MKLVCHSEVSALLIVLITVDRLLVLRFPLSGWRLTWGGATAACLSAWAVGGALAATPLLPATAHWRFYSQTGICMPLPFAAQGSFKVGFSKFLFVCLFVVLVL